MSCSVDKKQEGLAPRGFLTNGREKRHLGEEHSPQALPSGTQKPPRALETAQGHRDAGHLPHHWGCGGETFPQGISQGDDRELELELFSRLASGYALYPSGHTSCL